MHGKIKTTNAMRILDKNKISYQVKEYDYDENDLSGMTAAQKLNISPDNIFKTLVLKGERNGIIVCCIPVNQEINLKKLAAFSNDKKVEMIHVKELLSVTGYIRGGCSPIGMKKNYPIFIEKSACNLDFIAVSAGIRGEQIIIEPNVLIEFLNAKIYDNQ